MITIIEVFLGFSIGIAILWLTLLALVNFTRRVTGGEEWQDVLKDLWKKPSNAAPFFISSSTKFGYTSSNPRVAS
jgi:hypothetical protein